MLPLHLFLPLPPNTPYPPWFICTVTPPTPIIPSVTPVVFLGSSLSWHFSGNCPLTFSPFSFLPAPTFFHGHPLQNPEHLTTFDLIILQLIPTLTNLLTITTLTPLNPFQLNPIFIIFIATPFVVYDLWCLAHSLCFVTINLLFTDEFMRCYFCIIHILRMI